MNELLILFIVLNILNVILSTVKSLVTINGGKLAAAAMNAITFFVYTYVLIYTNSDLPMFTKALVVAICNFIGVYIVKLVEEKLRKEKLWKIEATVYEPYTESLYNDLKKAGIPCNYIPNIGKYTVFNIYCETQADSKKAKELLDFNKAKYFVSESKTLA